MTREHLQRLSPEEMAAIREKAKLVQQEKATFNKNNEHKYKLTYMDSGLWQELASKYKIRMPVYNEPVTAKGVRKYLKRVGISNDTWKDHYTSVDYFIEHNPKWTLYGAVGLLLELRQEAESGKRPVHKFDK